jgi:hypothetical protein
VKGRELNAYEEASCCRGQVHSCALQFLLKFTVQYNKINVLTQGILRFFFF